MGGTTEVEAPEPTQQETRLIDEMIETSKQRRQIELENVGINRMLFPSAARAIGLEPIYADDSRQPGQPAQQQPAQPLPQQQPTQPTQAAYGSNIFRAVNPGVFDGATVGPQSAAQQPATTGTEQSGVPSFGNIVGFRPTGENSLPGDMLASQTFRDLINMNLKIGQDATTRMTSAARRRGDIEQNEFSSLLAQRTGQSRAGIRGAIQGNTRGNAFAGQPDRPVHRALPKSGKEMASSLSPSERDKLIEALENDPELAAEIMQGMA